MTAPRSVPAIRTFPARGVDWFAWLIAAAFVAMPFAATALVMVILAAGIQWRTIGAYTLGVLVGAVTWAVHGYAKRQASAEEWDAWAGVDEMDEQ